jgi:IS30 family transposase
MVLLAERKSRFVLVGKVKERTAQAVQSQIFTLILLPLKDKFQFLTSDHGKEIASHEEIAEILDLNFYFAHPYAALERGTNENTNGLLRQYFPKKSAFTSVSNQEHKQAKSKLNSRPRNSLRFKTPLEVFYNTTVALTS